MGLHRGLMSCLSMACYAVEEARAADPHGLRLKGLNSLGGWRRRGLTSATTLFRRILRAPGMPSVRRLAALEEISACLATAAKQKAVASGCALEFFHPACESGRQALRIHGSSARDRKGSQRQLQHTRQVDTRDAQYQKKM